MLVYRQWTVAYAGRIRQRCEGWYLFGVLPLYVKKIEV